MCLARASVYFQFVILGDILGGEIVVGSSYARTSHIRLSLVI